MIKVEIKKLICTVMVFTSLPFHLSHGRGGVATPFRLRRLSLFAGGTTIAGKGEEC